MRCFVLRDPGGTHHSSAALSSHFFCFVFIFSSGTQRPLLRQYFFNFPFFLCYIHNALPMSYKDIKRINDDSVGCRSSGTPQHSCPAALTCEAPSSTRCITIRQRLSSLTRDPAISQKLYIICLHNRLLHAVSYTPCINRWITGICPYCLRKLRY